jgi:hypothetical protein
MEVSAFQKGLDASTFMLVSMLGLTRIANASRTLSRRGIVSWPGEQAAGKLPTNYGVRVVPQQEAWVVERFGKARVDTALRPSVGDPRFRMVRFSKLVSIS